MSHKPHPLIGRALFYHARMGVRAWGIRVFGMRRVATFIKLKLFEKNSVRVEFMYNRGNRVGQVIQWAVFKFQELLSQLHHSIFSYFPQVVFHFLCQYTWMLLLVLPFPSFEISSKLLNVSLSSPVKIRINKTSGSYEMLLVNAQHTLQLRVVHSKFSSIKARDKKIPWWLDSYPIRKQQNTVMAERSSELITALYFTDKETKVRKFKDQ